MDCDLFYVFRYLLCLVCGIYTLARICQGIWRWRQWLCQEGRAPGLLRGYLVVQLLRVRFRRHGPDILQILVLVLVLWQVILLHQRI
jgi:hypothetical protein